MEPLHGPASRLVVLFPQAVPLSLSPGLCLEHRSCRPWATTPHCTQPSGPAPGMSRSLPGLPGAAWSCLLRRPHTGQAFSVFNCVANSKIWRHYWWGATYSRVWDFQPTAPRIFTQRDPCSCDLDEDVECSQHPQKVPLSSSLAMPTHTPVPGEWRRPVVEYSQVLLAKIKHRLGRTLGVETDSQPVTS